MTPEEPNPRNNRENNSYLSNLPNRNFVTLPSELSSPEDLAKLAKVRRLAVNTFPEWVTSDETHRELVEATIDIMATCLVSTGINFGEGDAPENKLGKFYRDNPGNPDSMPH